MENIITIEEFEPKNIVLNNPSKNTHGGIIIPVHYQCPRRGKIPFIIKPPKSELPYGVSQFPTAEKVVKGQEDKVNYSLNISFNGFDNNFENNPKNGMFYKKWKEMESHIHKQLLKNSQAFLKQKVKSLDVMESMWWPIVKHSKNAEGEITNKYPPTFSIKLPRYGKEGTPLVFGPKLIDASGKTCKLTVDKTNTDANEYNVYEAFPRYSEVKTLIQCTAIQNVAKLSMSFKCIQVQVFPGKNQISGNAFAEDSDDESDKPMIVDKKRNEPKEESGGEESEEDPGEESEEVEVSESE